MVKIDNHYFTIYQLHYKEKFEIIKFIYNFCLYKSDLLKIMRIQTSNILIVANNIFISNKKK